VKRNEEIKALQNAADCSVPFAEVKEILNNDQRKVSKYALVRLGTIISPPLDYLTLNAFILGYGRGYEYAEEQAKEVAPHQR
jgi:hypothetical protein